jgi:peptidyl-prolyl cis-trans isomerase C
VGAELLYQASVEKNGPIDDAAIEQQLSALRGRFPDPSAFEQALAREGITLDDLQSQMERDLTIQRLIETDISPNVSVTEEAKRAFYDENPERMRQPDRLRLSHILKRVPPDASPEAKETAKSELESVLEQARGGADFAALAREHSEDPGSAANGGELTVTRGETVPPFEQAAFALEPGGLSGVVETQFGFHVIKLLEKTEGQLVPYEQVEPRIGEYLVEQAVREEIESTVETLKQNAAVELFI